MAQNVEQPVQDQVEQLLQQIKQLIGQGAELRVQGEKGYTPLYCLIGNYNPEGPTQFDKIVRTLIDSRSVYMNEIADNGDTALSLAAQYGNSRIFNYLLKKYANPTIGKNPFLVALQHNQPHILRYLLMGPIKQIEKQTATYQSKELHAADETRVLEQKDVV